MNNNFYIAIKDAPKKKWNKVDENLALHEALEKAKILYDSSNFYEIGVLYQSSSGGTIFWTSREPDLTNNSILLENYNE